MAQETAKNMVESPAEVRVPTSMSVASSSSTSAPRKIIERTDNCCRNYDNFKRSAVPVRFMYFNHDGCWTDFSTEVIDSLKSAFLNCKPLVDLSITGSSYLFDFMRMLQTDFDSGSQRSIAWIDENGKCFFPKKFIGEDFDLKLKLNHHRQAVNPTIEIDIRIAYINNNDGIKRKRKEEPEVSSGDVLKRQRLDTWPDCVRLLIESELAFATVRDYFLNGMKKIDPAVKITAVRQWEHRAPMRHARFLTFEKQIEVTKTALFRDGRSNVVYAWYGAPVKDVKSVLMYGFGLPSKVYGPDSYGIGVYLSPVGFPHLSVKYADVDENGEKHVVLCRVILGNLEQVGAGSSQDCPSGRRFDTGTDDVDNPKFFVVWQCNMSKHIIPEAVVSFKHSVQFLQGKLKGSLDTKKSLEKLISNLRNFLPLAKFQDVETLFKTFRAGKLSRDIFAKQFRLIVGDEVLMSIRREIRGQE
ncbi:probable inactive poly [ADP-ribose] polymerase SRO3 [Mercurialis annua]|uniref:probable inactive poly [ADP-ribose] polymerase SRO3 n=1 Tax=Mercurialis annua TaxID=3986 RepID=UPI00215ECEFE|nr:probable inactive poly [ADP-ribose] polymerase SRO3 [Mercurialis annua]